jgi:pterin-4a-carbinolamine dehydratase
MSYEAATKLRTKLHVDWIFDMPPSFVPTAITENSHSNSTTESSTIIHPSDTAHLDNISATNLTSIRPNTGNRKPYHNTTSTNQYALPLPMLTATEEVQRTFASLSPTTTAKTHPNNNDDDNNNNNDNNSNSSNTMTTSSTTTTTTTHHQPSTDAHHEVPSPLALIRTFQHPDFMSGSRFLQSIAAVGQMTSHYPALSLERKIINRHWYVITTVRCHTVVLGGLSTFDFHLATVGVCFFVVDVIG